MVAEIAHAPRKIHRTNWRRHSQIPDMALMARRLLDRRPVVMISGHLGNFEMGGYLLGLHGFPTHTIARKLDNPYLDRWINDFRAATGQYMLAKDGSSHEIDDVLESRRHARAAGRPARRQGGRAGSTSSASRPRRTRRSPCSRSPARRPRPRSPCSARAARCSSKCASPTWSIPATPGFDLGTIPAGHPVVHAAAGGADPRDARPVLVAPPPLARARRPSRAPDQATEAGRPRRPDARAIACRPSAPPCHNQGLRRRRPHGCHWCIASDRFATPTRRTWPPSGAASRRSAGCCSRSRRRCWSTASSRRCTSIATG